MADRTLTVKTVGQPDKTLTINRDRFAGVRTMTRQDADGGSSTITVNRSVAGTKYGDKPGQPRPLLGKVVGGAAAAFSLRDLNDKQGTSKILEARRDADNAEKTFKGKDMRTLEDWVNGKLETTLPCDVATASAAYSLRKVRDAYTGDAAQVRRPSDNVEVNVAFDANNEVSASSAITNISTGYEDLFGVRAYFDGINDNVVLGSQISMTGDLSLQYSFIVSQGNQQIIGRNTTGSYIRAQGTGSITGFRLSTESAAFSLSLSSSINYNEAHTIKVKRVSGDWGIYNASDTLISNTVSNGDTLILDSFGRARGSYGQGVIWDVRVDTNNDGTIDHSYNGYGNTLSDWEDLVGSNDATSVNGSPELFNGQGFGLDEGETTATTLGEFLTEATPARNRTGSAKYSTFTPDGVTGFTASHNNLAACGFDIAGASGTEVQVSFDIIVNSGSVNVKLRPDFETGSDASNNVTINTSGSKSFTLTSTADFKALLFTTASVDFVVSNFSVNVPYNHDAHVVTWYDQSVNGYHATQDTAGEQPKIASAGSLIADGINFFSGLNLELAGTGLDIFKNVSYGQIFSVIKPRETGTGSNRYFEASIGTGSGARFLFGDGQVAAGTFRIGGRALDGDSFGDEESPTGHSNQLSLITGFLNYTDAEGFLFLNGAQVATDSIPNMTAGNTSDTSSQSVAIGGNVAGNTAPFNAKELIIFNSDQSDNRFKIESNINNHYGIYNDANEFVDSEWSGSGFASFSSTSFEGFTSNRTSVGDSFASIEYDQNATQYHVSFRVDNPSGSTIRCHLRSARSGGSSAQTTFHNNNGLHTKTFTPDAGNPYFVFYVSGTAGDVTISDLTISTQTRNGFVETWYDQSGNGNNAVHDVTVEQPRIVEAGSLITNQHGSPTIRFSHTNTNRCYLEFDPFYATGDDISAFVVTERETNGDWNILIGHDNSNSALSGTFGMSDFGATKQPRTGVGGIAVNNSVVNDDVTNLRTALWDNSALSLSQYVDGGDLTTGTGTGNSVAPPDKNRIGDTYTAGVFGTTKISEVVLYTSDQSANRSAIESNIADEYGITLS